MYVRRRRRSSIDAERVSRKVIKGGRSDGRGAANDPRHGLACNGES